MAKDLYYHPIGNTMSTKGYHHSVPSGKRLHNELGRSTMFHGKIHYTWLYISYSYVKLPQGKDFSLMTLDDDALFEVPYV